MVSSCSFQLNFLSIRDLLLSKAVVVNKNKKYCIKNSFYTIDTDDLFKSKSVLKFKKEKINKIIDESISLISVEDLYRSGALFRAGKDKAFRLIKKESSRYDIGAISTLELTIAKAVQSTKVSNSNINSDFKNKTGGFWSGIKKIFSSIFS